MRLTPIALPPEIAPWIHQMWVFESERGLPPGDARVVVPNGRPKLIIPWRNGLMAEASGLRQVHDEGDAVLIGLWDAPTVISSSPAATVSIGIEFKPNGLSRFVAGDMSDLNQKILPIGDVLGALGDRLRRRVMAAETCGDAVRAAIGFLLERFRALETGPARLADEALRLMGESGYRLDVADLERRLGYSRRYIAAVFQRDVGLAPKRLNSILAFERLYRAFSQHKSASLLRDDALDLFYDQSHFIRHFKQFTGTSPRRFAEMDNEFGRIFYRTREATGSSHLSNTDREG
ncbi:DUF6597 domain-containing transcriptional factor [Oryzibacter oryziterrae]|uniref:DUF6597 domain-containing transcriptional factor n=1 Tax=Oryzibacter oryziterrae TaxID=2766474 RepID=UPI001F00B928|nr:DUF6597 domain-containing transcriptional factor [Oryzibacter oryziterrae]